LVWDCSRFTIGPEKGQREMNDSESPQGGATPHRYGEAFKKMLYRSDDGTESEIVWNSRNGVTPFIITSKSGKSLSHDEWDKDEHCPDYVPSVPGERFFYGPPNEPHLAEVIA
jgi:hypothetical protein